MASLTGLSAVGCGLAVVGRYFYGNFIEYSLALKAEVLNGLMGCHYRLWQGQHRQPWLAVVVSCLSSWQIAHNPRLRCSAIHVSYGISEVVHSIVLNKRGVKENKVPTPIDIISERKGGYGVRIYL